MYDFRVGEDHAWTISSLFMAECRIKSNQNDSSPCEAHLLPFNPALSRNPLNILADCTVHQLFIPFRQRIHPFSNTGLSCLIAFRVRISK